MNYRSSATSLARLIDGSLEDRHAFVRTVFTSSKIPPILQILDTPTQRSVSALPDLLTYQPREKTGSNDTRRAVVASCNEEVSG